MSRLRVLPNAARCLLALAAGTAPLLAASPGRAQAPEAARSEARERFDRGLRLFNQGDAGGALAEFLRAYELSPHPLVLYNVALVYEVLAKPVQAVDTADRLLAQPGNLSADRIAKLQALRAEQASRIGTLELVVETPGASVDVDGEAVGTTPLPGPLRVATGSHVVSVISRDHLPVRRTLLVASGAKLVEKVTLEPLTGRLAQLTLVTKVPDAQVLIDGQPVGLTPLPASLALAPGNHQIELVRSGYESARRSVALGEGSSGTLELDPLPSPATLATAGGTLTLAISEPDSVIFIDGEPRGAYAGPLRLPAGKHRLRVERAGFFSFERDALVPLGSRADVAVELQPTPEWRADYVSSARTRRTWGYITGGTGAVLVLGGAGFLIWNAGEKSEKEETFDALIHESEPGSGRRCDPMSTADASCPVERQIALEELDDARARDVFGWVGVGVGAAALGLGAVLVLTGDDPNRYEPRPESDVFGRLRLEPLGYAAPGGGMAGVRGAF
ncbi:MAG TPA: PEGA domain-containing protein [Polyangiaceae bacterium]